MTNIQEYLAIRTELEGKEAKRYLKNQTARYILIEGELYKRSFTMPYLKCLGEKEDEYALRKVYEGRYGSHLGVRADA